MIAVYERDSWLNVRETPGGKAIGSMAKGDEVKALEARDGWVKTARGYVMTKFVTLLPGEPGEAPEEPPKPEEAGESPEEAEGPAEEPSAEEAPKLEAMTLAELREMAAQCGIDLKKGMRKQDVIEAILNE